MSLLTNSLWPKQSHILYSKVHLIGNLLTIQPTQFLFLIPVFWRKKLKTFPHSDWFLNRIFMSTRRESVQSLKCSFQNNSSVKFKFIAKFIWDLFFIMKLLYLYLVHIYMIVVFSKLGWKFVHRLHNNYHVLKLIRIWIILKCTVSDFYSTWYVYVHDCYVICWRIKLKYIVVLP